LAFFKLVIGPFPVIPLPMGVANSKSLDHKIPGKQTNGFLAITLAVTAVRVHESTVRKTLGKRSARGKLLRRDSLLAEKNSAAHFSFVKDHHKGPDTFGQSDKIKFDLYSINGKVIFIHSKMVNSDIRPSADVPYGGGSIMIYSLRTG